MATKSIGTTGRDYSTIQAWEDSLIAILTEAERGECYNDSEFTAGIDFSAHTTTVVNSITLTAATGQSFQDHADVRTNPLRYDQAKGVGITYSTAYTAAILFSGTNGDVLIERLQLKRSNLGACIGLAVGTTHVYRNLILETTGGGSMISSTSAGPSKIVNVVCIQRNTGTGECIKMSGNGQILGCVLVRPDNITAAGTGLKIQYAAAALLQSTCIFGFTTVTTGTTFSASCGNNATDQASGLPGSNNVHAVSFTTTTPFVNGDNTSPDMRLADDGNDLHDAGFYDGTNGPNDISGTARSASTPDIGAWEIGAAAGGGGGRVARKEVHYRRLRAA